MAAVDATGDSSAPEALNKSVASTTSLAEEKSRVKIQPQSLGTSSGTARPKSAAAPAQHYSQFGARGGKFSAAKPKSDVDWAIYRAKHYPGPGEYKIDAGYRVSGGKFNLSKPKSDVEWTMYRAARQPGPGDYYLGSEVDKVNGGKFNLARPKSALDWTIYRAQNSPGPGQYEPDNHYKVNGGKFSHAKPKTDVDWSIYRAKRQPGPGQYKVDQEGRIAGGRFNLSKPKSDVDWAIYTAAQRPGPQDYDSDSHHRISGGRFSTARPKSALDVTIDTAKQQPGPGEYNSDITSIGRRTGAVDGAPSKPSAPSRPKSAPGIPPEARGKPKPRDPNESINSTLNTPKTSRPQTSMGIPPEARRTPRTTPALPPRATSAPPGRPEVSQHQKRKTINVNMSTEPTSGQTDRPPQVIRPVTASPNSARHAHQHRSISPAQRREEEVHAAQPSKKDSQYRPGSWRTQPRKPKTKSISVQASQEDLDMELSGSLPRSNLSPIGTPLSSSRLASARPTARQNPPRPQSQNYRRSPFPVTAAPVRSSRRISSKRKSASVGPYGPSPYAVPQHGPSGRGHLSDNARKLFDLAMQSSEFKKMMELYTGVKDPTSIIEKYAIMWSNDPGYRGPDQLRPPSNMRRTIA